ncbi:MAG: hypothetical protein RI101_08575 [Nitrospira sp.]|jgi:hypothetical protein|nr:hypothetical protein [Nitrospira sp.]
MTITMRLLITVFFLGTTVFINDSSNAEVGAAGGGGGGAAAQPPAAPPTDWRNYGFGVALTYTQDLGRHDRVKNAQVVNGVVRVTEDGNALPRIMLETHYFFKPEADLFWGVKAKEWGHGPFVALQPGSQNIVEAVAIGWMIGFRRADGDSSDITKNSSFNLGVGFVVDPKVQVLGEGITKNQALPSGETQIRYRDTAQYGILILSSFSF